MANANQIEVGQLLRVVPPGRRERRAWRGNRAGGAGCRPVPADRFGPSGRRACRRDDQHASRCSGGACIGRGSQAATPSASASAPASDIRLAWPASGQLIGKFDEKSNKGIDIAGKRAMQSWPPMRGE
jgi:lipoprotein NlpD